MDYYSQLWFFLHLKNEENNSIDSCHLANTIPIVNVSIQNCINTGDFHIYIQNTTYYLNPPDCLFVYLSIFSLSLQQSLILHGINK